MPSPLHTAILGTISSLPHTPRLLKHITGPLQPKLNGYNNPAILVWMCTSPREACSKCSSTHCGGRPLFEPGAGSPYDAFLSEGATMQIHPLSGDTKGSFRAVQGIAKQHGDGHGTNAARDRGDVPRHFLHLVELHIPRQAVSPLLGWILQPHS